MSKHYNYKNVRMVCKGKIKSCDSCHENNEFLKDGFCVKCGRPLWKKPGEPCEFILGYHDRNFERLGQIVLKCKYCNTLTTI
jgi:hypothetical protein